MFKKAIVLTVIGLIGTVIWAALPLVSNPDPDYQTDLSYQNLDTTNVENVWAPPTAQERIRARVIIQGEQILFEHGPTDMIMNTHSMRKSFLSLLYGIAVDKGMIDITKTLAELGIDENTPLTEQEKTATIRDLLMFRSGIYIAAEGEHDNQITDRPKRGSHKPGELFFSNNFDANALGTIFIQETGYTIGDFMEEFLARPLGLQDFSSDNIVMGSPWFMPNNGSQHEMYNTYLSARDTARIGAMVAQGGRWNGVQVVPQEWIKTSTSPLSDLTTGPVKYQSITAFGYVWWIYKDEGLVRTDGYGEHLMLIDPAHDFTLVERNFTGNSYLSTGRWMLMGDNKFSNTFPGAFKAHELLVKVAD